MNLTNIACVNPMLYLPDRHGNVEDQQRTAVAYE